MPRDWMLDWQHNSFSQTIAARILAKIDTTYIDIKTYEALI